VSEAWPQFGDSRTVAGCSFTLEANIGETETMVDSEVLRIL